MWSDNLNSLKRIQRKKVGVARDYVSRAPAHGEFEELIVFRITTHHQSYVNLNPFRLASQSRQKTSNVLFIYVSLEFLPAQNFIEFGKRRKGEQHSSFL